MFILILSYHLTITPDTSYDSWEVGKVSIIPLSYHSIVSGKGLYFHSGSVVCMMYSFGWSRKVGIFLTFIPKVFVHHRWHDI